MSGCCLCRDELFMIVIACSWIKLEKHSLLGSLNKVRNWLPKKYENILLDDKSLPDKKTKYAVKLVQQLANKDKNKQYTLSSFRVF